MRSFDVSSLFTNVPVCFTINLILDSVFSQEQRVHWPKQKKSEEAAGMGCENNYVPV